MAIALTTRQLAARLVTAVHLEAEGAGNTLDQYDLEIEGLLLSLKASGYWFCRVTEDEDGAIIHSEQLSLTWEQT